MAFTTLALFNGITQTVTGDRDFASLSNALVDDTAVAAADLSTGTFQSEIMIVNEPLSGPEVPSSATIDAIRIEIRCRFVDVSGGDAELTDIQIDPPGSFESDINISSGFVTYNKDQSPTLWGLTQGEAREFADNLNSLDFRYSCNRLAGTIGDFEVQWLKCRFEYTPATSGGILLAAL